MKGSVRQVVSNESNLNSEKPEQAFNTGPFNQAIQAQAEAPVFHSVLFPSPEDGPEDDLRTEPSFFSDLNLNQIVERITSDWKDYDLMPYFYAPLRSLGAIAYRQEIVRDLQDATLIQSIQAFSEAMRTMRKRLDRSKNLHYKRAADRVFLGAVQAYCEAIPSLADSLAGITLDSRGIRDFRTYLAKYVGSSEFRQLVEEVMNITSSLSEVRYGLRIKGDVVTIREYEGEINYSEAVEETFSKFRATTTTKHWVEPRKLDGMNHIQAQILDRVALLYPETFAQVEVFVERHRNYLDQTISRFDREIQFYVAYLGYITRFQHAGLEFCEPQVSATSKEIECCNAFDLALADQLIGQRGRVVTNDFFLRDPERIFVVSGPNQGGKTTFARTFGQLHYLASLGCPVPGSHARLFMSDWIFTHFERVEDISNFRGKLQDELMRIHQILEQATPGSLIVINEIFASTTLKDAVYLGKKVMARISELDALAVCVTFLDELASFDNKTVSVVASVDPENLSARTYKLERKPADGLAYALAIAEKHQVTYEQLKKRIVR